MSQAAADAAKRIREWRINPVKFAWDNFGFDPDPWQRKVLELLPDPAANRIAMKACKGPGKTATEAVIGWWFLCCQGDKYEHPKAAAVAITRENLRDGLWTEMAKWRIRSPWIERAFEWTAERVFAKDHPETWYMSARAWSKSADKDQQANTLAGLHAKYLLFLLDESGGIPRSVMAAAEAGLATMAQDHWLKIIQAGNPTHLEGPLYDACTRERHLWQVVEITGDPDDPNRSTRINVQWAREQIEKYGRDNPWVLVNVFGQFPPSSLNALLGPDECAAASRRHLRDDEYDFAPRVMGVDCARFGDDRTVIAQRQGLASFDMAVMRNARTQEIGGQVMTRWQNWKADACFIDNAMGNGVIDYCKLLDYDAIGIDFAGKPKNPRYANKRAEMWFEMAEWIKAGGVIPRDDELIAELCAPTYSFTNTGKIIIEPKDDVKERLGRSPDKADALALTFAETVMPAERPEYPFLQRQQGRVDVDYDPFARA